MKNEENIITQSKSNKYWVRAIKSLIPQYANKNQLEHSAAFVIKCQCEIQQFIDITAKNVMDAGHLSLTFQARGIVRLIKSCSMVGEKFWKWLKFK